MSYVDISRLDWRPADSAPENVPVLLRLPYPSGGWWVVTAQMFRWCADGDEDRGPATDWTLLHYNGEALLRGFRGSSKMEYAELPSPQDAIEALSTPFLEHAAASSPLEDLVMAAYEAGRQAEGDDQGDPRGLLRVGAMLAPLTEALSRSAGRLSDAEKYQAAWRESQDEVGRLREQLRTEQARLNALGARLICARTPSAASDVLAERLRQVNEEGFSAQHDDAHSAQELARAALHYAASYLRPDNTWWSALTDYGMGWPWVRRWWKPARPRRMLVKAAALLLAEIERLDRAAPRPEGEV